MPRKELNNEEVTVTPEQIIFMDIHEKLALAKKAYV
jgi:hypothetical protein